LTRRKRPAAPQEQEQLSKYVGFGASAIRNDLFPIPHEYAKRQEPNRLIWPNLVRDARWKLLAERIEPLPLEWQQSILQSSQYAHDTSEGIIRYVWSAQALGSRPRSSGWRWTRRAKALPIGRQGSLSNCAIRSWTRMQRLSSGVRRSSR